MDGAVLQPRVYTKRILMKPSQLNSLIRSAARCFEAHHRTLPPNALWDITDFGLGDWQLFG